MIGKSIRITWCFSCFRPSQNTQKLRLCGYGIKAIISAFQAEDVGSIPTTHTSRSTFQAIMEMGVFAARVRGLMRKARTATLSSNSQMDKTFPLNGNNAGSTPASVKDVPWFARFF